MEKYRKYKAALHVAQHLPAPARVPPRSRELPPPHWHPNSQPTLLAAGGDGQLRCGREQFPLWSGLNTGIPPKAQKQFTFFKWAPIWGLFYQKHSYFFTFLDNRFQKPPFESSQVRFKTFSLYIHGRAISIVYIKINYLYIRRPLTLRGSLI